MIEKPTIDTSELKESQELRNKYPITYKIDGDGVNITIGEKEKPFKHGNSPAVIVLSYTDRAIIATKTAGNPKDRLIGVTLEHSPEGYDETGKPRNPDTVVYYKKTIDLDEKISPPFDIQQDDNVVSSLNSQDAPGL